MALRRLAQENYAASSGSPRTPDTIPGTPALADSPTNSPLPSTPRGRISFGTYRSPASTPSISSSVPFDWNAARTRRPPPYATPPQNRPRKSMGVGGSGSGAPARKAVVRKKSFLEKITSIPSVIAFEIALFPHNVPLPSSKTSAWILGGLAHFINLCVRISQIRKVPDSDLGWEDMYREGEGESWFDWTVPVTILLVSASFLNTLYLLTRIRIYRLHQRSDPVSSPNAKFVSEQLDLEPLKLPSMGSRIYAGAWYTFSVSWRFLLGMKPPTPSVMSQGKTARVLQLDVWAPGELEMTLFNIYSPAHALLWMATSSSNWMIMLIIMGLATAQLSVLTQSYNALIKDKDIISAEVLNEYNQGFVYPRLNPIRKDVAVMTHQSEVVNVWED
ncbi:hypothetical protein BD779DRAFT_1669104 [Infundibulicybe gibba]|nr:hypothetical protein BD779DRAFT_1669104 [Infundibulicybe gibba]